MNDLISRAEAMDASEKFIKDCNPDHFIGHQKFIEYMDNAEIGSFGKWQFANGFNMGLTAAEVAIQKLPSAQKTGKWTRENNYGMWECSVCGCRVKRENPLKGNTWNYHYCPNCGARMDEE